MITQNFFNPTKAFNLENIVQACPVSFQTHRVNKDISNSVKDLDFTSSELSFFSIGQ